MSRRMTLLVAGVMAAVAVLMPGDAEARAKKQVELKACKCACWSNTSSTKETNHHEFVAEGVACFRVTDGSCKVFSGNTNKWEDGTLRSCVEDPSRPHGKPRPPKRWPHARDTTTAPRAPSAQPKP